MGHEIATAYMGYRAAQSMMDEALYGTEKPKKVSFIAKIFKRKPVTA